MRHSIASGVRLLLLAAILVPLAALAAPKPKDAGAPDAARASASAVASVSASASAQAPPPPASDSAPVPGSGAAPSAAPSAPVAPPTAGVSSAGASHAAPSASAPAAAGAEVHIHDRKVFTVKVGRAGQTAAQRAADASQVLERASDESDTPEVTVDEKGDVAIVFAGGSPVIQLGPDDAAAEGDASLSVHAAAVASKVRDGIAAERKRSALATTVFSFSLLVFSALLVVLALGKLGQLVGRGRDWIAAHPDKLPNVRVAGIEVVRPVALRGGILVAIDAAKWLLRLGVAYAWLLFALSLFDATRAYSEKLTGFVLAPISALMGRAASALPVLLVAAIAALAVLLLVRFVGLFFSSVARGETSLSWLPLDLAAPTSVLVRAGIVLLALVLAAPLVTGSDDGALSRAGLVALVVLGLSTMPLVACVAVGTAVVFGRRLKVGEYAEVGGRSGVVRALSLLEVTLDDGDGCEVRVPHLASLLHATRLLGPQPPVTVEIAVASRASHGKVLELLAQTAGTVGARPRIDLVRIDDEGALYSVTIFSAAKGARSVLLSTLADALAKASVALGKAPRPRTG